MAQTRLEIAKRDIIKCFEGSQQKVFRFEQISRILQENREFWRLAQHTNTKAFINWLIEISVLKEVMLKGQEGSISKVVYTFGDVDTEHIAAALGPPKKTYLGYYTAAAMHDLTEQIPKTVYSCIEQSQKQRKEIILTQEMVDSSYSKSARQSGEIYQHHDKRICIVNAVNSRMLGTDKVRDLWVTDIERTLIDAAVRPHYCGGLARVFSIYREATRKNISINRIRGYLLDLKYLYPYHQAIGFLLEQAGVDQELMSPLYSLPRTLDLPLQHGMTRSSYSSRWRVFYPDGLGDLS